MLKWKETVEMDTGILLALTLISLGVERFVPSYPGVITGVLALVTGIIMLF